MNILQQTVTLLKLNTYNTSDNKLAHRNQTKKIDTHISSPVLFFRWPWLIGHSTLYTCTCWCLLWIPLMFPFFCVHFNCLLWKELWIDWKFLNGRFLCSNVVEIQEAILFFSQNSLLPLISFCCSRYHYSDHKAYWTYFFTAYNCTLFRLTRTLSFFFQCSSLVILHGHSHLPRIFTDADDLFASHPWCLFSHSNYKRGRKTGWIKDFKYM